MSKILEYAKSIVAAVGAVAAAVQLAVADQAVSFDEANGIWLAITGLLTVLGVYAVRNAPPGDVS
jgi:hypothetical protein